MPDGMSEYMPDNMPAGGDHWKKGLFCGIPEIDGYPLGMANLVNWKMAIEIAEFSQ